MSVAVSTRRVLIVIPCLDEEAFLPALLARFLAEPDVRTIVVADGGSTDRSRRIAADAAARDGRVIPIDNPWRLQAAGINRAVRLHGPGHDWLVRIDAHCGYPEKYVAGLLAAAARHRADCVVVPLVSHGTRGFQIAAAAAQNSRLGTGGSPHRHVGTGGFVDHGHHALMSLDGFVRAGGYDETMATNEDAELDHRIGQAGGRIWLEPSLALAYYPRATPRGLWRQYARYGRGRAQTAMRHGIRLKPRQWLPALLPVAVAPVVLAPLWWPFAVPFAAWALVCLGLGAGIGVRARSGWAMLSGVAAMIMHLAWGSGFLRQRLRRGPPPPA